MCLKSILLCHIHVYIDRFVCVFSFLPVSRTTTAILLSHNCFLAPSTHSSTAASQIHYRKDLLPQLMLLTARPALSSLYEDWFFGERQGVTSSKRRCSALQDVGNTTRKNTFFFFWQSLRVIQFSKGGESPPNDNSLGHLERFFTVYVLWGFCILLQKEVYSEEVFAQLQLETGLDQNLLITESQTLEMPTHVFTLHSSDPTFHYIRPSNWCFLTH